MIRPTTVLCMLAAFGSGLYLYTEKHRTALLDRDISRVFHATQVAHERTGLLRAEWALLNEPGRLQEMAGRYLPSLHPMAPSQFVQIADLQTRLPAPVLTPPPGSTDTDIAAPDAAAADAALSAAADVPAAAVKPDPAPAPKLASRDEAKPRPPHHVAVASRDTSRSVLPRGTPLPLASPQPVGATYMSAMARPMRAMPRPTIVAAVPRYATAAPYVASSLGGGQSLPPPVPFGAGAGDR